MSTSRIIRPATMEIAMLTTTTHFRLKSFKMTVEANAAIIMTTVGSVEIKTATLSCPG